MDQAERTATLKCFLLWLKAIEHDIEELRLELEKLMESEPETGSLGD